ncbi:hypothetical protein SLEP1_g3772 [Rubroshorea leprosula]|uniref:Retrotransposon gag domain-containing protein n=1 Tax=Rubroshorea leprosula TaxID=152421 RepID=A0AAV5HUR4_9ROSI|nr:hypothetical protein SLEP1_g3772 [Rubroshorea leprosula]
MARTSQPHEVHTGATDGNGGFATWPNTLTPPVVAGTSIDGAPPNAADSTQGYVTMYDGRKGSTVEHVSKFLDAMGVHANNRDLCLREFSKSLSDRAYTWYTTLPLGFWIVDGAITLPQAQAHREPSNDDKRNPKYCRYHCFVNHATMDCFSLRRMYHRQVLEGLLKVPNRRQRVDKDPFPLHNQGAITVLTHVESVGANEPIVEFPNNTPNFFVRALQRTPKFKMLFDQLGFTIEVRQRATEAILSIANEARGKCLNVEVYVSHAYLESSNAVTFIDKDVEASIVKSSLSIVGFGSSSEHTLGYVQLELKVGPVQSQTTFYVIDAKVSYHLLLGRPWLHRHKIVPSTYHQCVKGRLNGKVSCTLANPLPFDQIETHFIEATFYDEFAPSSEAIVSCPSDIVLLAWNDIKDKPNLDI